MVGTTGERLGDGGSPVATDRVATFKISFLVGFRVYLLTLPLRNTHVCETARG